MPAGINEIVIAGNGNATPWVANAAPRLLKAGTILRFAGVSVVLTADTTVLGAGLDQDQLFVDLLLDNDTNWALNIGSVSGVYERTNGVKTE